MNKILHFNRPIWKVLLVTALMLLSTIGVATANAATTPCATPYTVQSGDTLSSIAVTCGVTYSALVQANPQISNPNLILVGEQINIPSSTIPITGGTATPTPLPTSGIYNVQAGDTLSSIAQKYGVTLGALEQVNTQIANWDLIYVGEQINLPAGAIPITGGTPTPTPAPGTSIYTVQSGDTLSSIAQSHGVTLGALEQANSQISDWNLIYAGEQINIPAATIPITGGSGTYIVQPGDTMTKIAQSYNITLSALEQANPQIINPNLIFPGEQINIP